MDSTATMFKAAELGVRLELEEGSDRILVSPVNKNTDEIRQGIRENRDMLRKDLMIRDAHEFLDRNMVAGADLSGLDGWHAIIGQQYMDADPEGFKYAIRGYTRAGLRAFREAKRRLEVA